MKMLGLVCLCIYSIGNTLANSQPNVSAQVPATIPVPANNRLLQRNEKLAMMSGVPISFFLGRRRGRGKARSDYDCRVTGVPAKIRREMGLNHFYKKYAHAYGVPIISSNNVDDPAIERACYVVRFALADRQDVRDWLHDRYGRAGIIDTYERTTDIPEHSFLPNWWNQRARGLGATLSQPISTAGEENILCYKSDRYYGGGEGEDIFLHEFAHAIHNLGVTGAIPNFDRKIRRLYNRRKRDGRWKNTYFMSTDREFFAEGVTSYFNVNTQTHDGKANGIHNHVNTRSELKAHDSELYELVRSVFPCENKFLDRCSARNGATPPSFKMNCNSDGGIKPTGQPKPKTGPRPPIPTTSKKGCINESPHCNYWRRHCVRNPRVRSLCKKTCFQDYDKNCRAWAKDRSKDYCRKNDYVKKNCRKSCGKC